MAAFTETKTTLDDIAARSEANRKRLEQAKVLISTAEADLAAMPAAYGGFVTQLDTDAAANSGDTAWQNAVAEKDQMVSDFQALKARASALVVAVAE